MPHTKVSDARLLEVMETITATIAQSEQEEEFYRRSAQKSTREFVKRFFLEIAEDLNGCRKKLEAKRQILSDMIFKQGIHQ